MNAFLSQLPVSESSRHLIGMGIIFVGTIIAAWIIRYVLWGVIQHFAEKTKSDLDDRLLAATRMHVYLLVYLWGLTILFNYIESIYVESAGKKIFDVIDGITYSIGVLIVANLLARLIRTSLIWYGENVAARTESTVDDEFVPLLDRAGKIVVYVLAILIVLDHFSIDVKGLIAVLGVGSLAIALAAQDTIANMIAGFVIMIDRPFRIGDRLKLHDGTVCTVHQIGIRSTRLVTLQNTMIVSPNSELTKSSIHNLSYPTPEIQVQVSVRIAYDSDIDKVRTIMVDQALKHPKVVDTPAPSVSLNTFGKDALEVDLFCRVAYASDQAPVAAELREQILARFRKEHIVIPYPQMVVTIEGGGKNRSSTS